MRSFALTSGLAALITFMVAHAASAAGSERPAPWTQPKPGKTAGYGTSGAGAQGSATQTPARRPETRKRPGLESMEMDRPYGYGRSGYDGGHGRSGEGDGWLGWRNFYRR